MKIDKKILVMSLIVLIALMGLSSVYADPWVRIMNSSFRSTDTTPTIWFNYTDATNATADCDLHMDGVVRASNTSTNNNTASALTPTTALDFGVYTTFINCTTTPGSESNVTGNITVGVSQINCTSTDRTIAGFLMTFFLLGIMVMLAFFGIKANNAKMIVGAVVALIIWVIAIGIINPVIVGLCG